jgi:Chaperone of endosialidase/Head domain of trimeric autotransporter adhesin
VAFFFAVKRFTLLFSLTVPVHFIYATTHFKKATTRPKRFAIGNNPVQFRITNIHTLSMKTNLTFILALGLLTSQSGNAQNIGIGTQAPNGSAILDVSSTTKGILVPRMTTAQRTAIANPAQGLLVYDTNEKGFAYYDGTAWSSLTGGVSGGVFKVTNGQVHNTGNVQTDNFIFGRNSLPQTNEPVEDKFMFFHKNKGALRAGSVAQEDFNWAPENIGNGSIALGHNNIASENGSVALGGSNISSGVFSTALGNFTVASGSYSTSTGNSNKATGDFSFAGGFMSESKENSSFSFGSQNKSNARESVTFGEMNMATAPASMAINSTNQAKGWYSLAGGKSNRAGAIASAALGTSNVTNSYSSFVIGRFNDSLDGNISEWIDNDALFMIGNGSSNANRRNAMTVLKNGNTGIGTAQPLTALHISRDGSQAFGQLLVEETGSNNDGARITFKNKFDNNRYWDLYGYPGNGESGPARFTFHYGGIRDVLTLSGVGYAGIGNSNPNASLDIQGPASAAYPQLRTRVNTADYVRMRMANTVHSNSYWDIASITSNSSTPSANMNFYYFHNNTGGWNILSLQGNGNATLMGTLTQNSDERLKKNIEPIANPFDQLQQLSGYHYQWKDERRDSATQTGLLAQEVEKVMPELVKVDDKGIKSVNYNGLVPYLLEAIKELKAEVDALKKK